MRSPRLPWCRQSDVSHARLARGKDHARPSHTAAAQPAVPASESSTSPCADELLGQLGIDGMERVARHSAPSSRASVDTPDTTDVLIDTLHAQYWRALADPHASATAEWASIAATAEPATRTTVLDSPECPDASRDHDSIEALLFGDRTLEDVFERLDEHTDPLSDDEPVPEILHLFAPPDFRATAAQHPPALTRREHHTLTIDSPLSAPVRKDED
ncbi:TagK domain-containing protein [Burkholderia sp. BCC0044]|uniref:TagK domain-containing protein n=1 Tax=Burkholderia sp. BCC0044 TaxID=2676295 RepID=UPI00158850A6|nr:TagK domain-containing protein [Burkholderia sp. BCC0044]